MPARQKVAVVGLGVNNRPLVPFFVRRGIDVVVADRKPREDIRASLVQMGDYPGVHVLGGDRYLEDLLSVPGLDACYLTPGMVKRSPVLEALAQSGVRITCETDLFFQWCPAPVIGITGSAGKTTTTTLVGEALKRDGSHPVFVGGNIGYPLLPELERMTPESWVVMELSSFQLELVDHSPHGAAVLNLSPNHLDVHGSFEEYRASKQRILRYQEPHDWVVVPHGPGWVDPMLAGHRGRKVFFSLSDDIPHGAFFAEGTVWWRGGNGQKAVVRADEILVPGDHNISNVLAATAIVASAGGDLAALTDVLRTFRGVPHRLEIVGIKSGVTYINDSIATAPDRTLAAVRAIKQPVLLIAGGYDKHLEYDTLGKELNNSSVKFVVVLGQTKEKLERAIRQYTDIPVKAVDSLEDAVEESRKRAASGDVVLLSPASASYDMFTNFEERGQKFRDIVGTL